MRRYCFPWFYRWLVRPWLRYIIGVRFENQHVFDSADQYVIVANHNSHFDTISILAALPNKKLLNTHPVAAGDYFGKTKFLSWITRTFINTILIHRHRLDNGVSTIDLLDLEIKSGKSLILFPEGSRGTPGVVADFKSGIAVLLKKNPGLPFIPVYLNGFGRVLPKNSSLIIPLYCTVQFGSPIVLDENTEVHEAVDLIRACILKLRDADERDDNQFAYT